jgi:hypothetical protein
MARRVPKALVHPDGSLFCLWHPAQQVYSPIFTDEDYPTPARELTLNAGPHSVTDLGSLRWVPVTLETQPQVQSYRLAPYDPETGEGL